ncbi:hypothetical protein P4646_00460 [Peribacillus simplex]|uniref:hypothetical protein n=1 Tax=Peribacillus simplex TaxID=1478 RepID=UPI001DCB64C1|nr:hypothetical protein [Peribacillus simplex]MED3982556.1 hypothetical protein [Peribacillus simplex]MED4095889.1 hypothetical protein [Peribacillus simplex]CAH0153855.1 hypothetical protein SRABI84_00766 [Peribacillus simplex]
MEMVGEGTIGELKKSLKPHGIKISVDVTRENDDPFWSKSLERKALGKIAAYIIIMGYVVHWGEPSSWVCYLDTLDQRRN